MNQDFYQKLFDEGIISAESLAKAEHHQKHPLLSVHWELKTLLYLGVMLLSTGLGILIYKNIDTIGHQVILLMIALISAGCFAYCIRNKKSFSALRIASPSPLFDYLLLLGCLSFVIFVGYLQFEYTFFGTHYGMATLVPMVVLFLVAYQFDHLGILSMAITNMGLWMGLTVSPFSIISGTMEDSTIIYSYLLLGVILLAAGYLSERYTFKKHFRFTYQHFGLNIGYLALLTGYFHNYDSTSCVLWLLGIFILSYILYADAYREKSFYFLFLIIMYSYFTISSLVFRALSGADSDGSMFYGFSLYFIISASCLIALLIRLNKQIKSS